MSDRPPTGRRPDLRLLPAAAAAWVGCVVTTRLGPVSGVVVALVALAVAAAGIQQLRRTPRGRHRRRLLVRGAATATLAGVACAAVVLTAAAHVHRREEQVAPHLGTTASLELRVTSDPRPLEAWAPGAVQVEGTWTATRADDGSRVPASVPVPVALVTTSWTDVVVGEHLLVTARVAPTGPGDASGALLVVDGPPTRLARAPPLARAVAELRAGLLVATQDLSPQARGLVPGIAIGDDRLLPIALEDDLRTVSLTHVTAVSGAHVALVVGLVLAAVAWLPRGPRVVAAAAALVGMVVLVHPSSSVVRAAAMGGVMLLGTALSRPRAALPALGVSVLVLLAVDPWLSTSFGFALSVLATGGLLLGSGPLADRLAAVLPRPLATALAIPVAAQLACLPVLLVLQPTLPVHGVLANVLAAPAVPPATLLGLGATLVHPVLPGTAVVMAGVASGATAWIAAVATWCAALPGAAAPWPALGLPVVVAVTVTWRARRARSRDRHRRPR